MKKLCLIMLVLSVFTWNAWATWEILYINEIVFGDAITFFNGNPNDASVVVTGKIPRQRTAIDIWPHNGPLPERHAITETVWYRTRFKDWPNFERISMSAMQQAIANDGSITPPHYRFSVEQGGKGKHLPIYFCFEGQIVGGKANCPLIIDPVRGAIIQ